MDEDGDDKDDTKRRTRNLSEKKRRDQFNLLVNELGSMVSTNNRKMDKSTVLKSTISFLKNHKEITVRSRAHDINDQWKPAFLSNEEFTYLVLEALEGFVMVFSASGQIYYVSESIASLLGHNPVDVVNKSVFDLTYEEDRPRLFNLLQNPPSAVEPNQPVTSENEISFQCHLQRGSLDFRDQVSYELIQFNGHFRSNREQGEIDDLYGEPEPSLLFVCTGKLHTPQLIRDVSLMDSNRSEFTSRHSLEWKFLFLDHRAPPIIGYLPFEVLGTSGYDYYHFDDLEKVVSCHEALMQKGELTSCYYRFLTKGQQWIWLQTRYYITYHQWNSKPEFVVCTHRVVSQADIAKNAKQETVEPDTTTEAEQPAAAAATVAMEQAPPDEAALIDVPTHYIPDANDALGTYQSNSQTASVKSASGSTNDTVGTSASASTSWPRASHSHYHARSDTASMSGESGSSLRNEPHENEIVSTGDGGQYYSPECEGGVMVYPQKGEEAEAGVVQHEVGAQYVEPGPYSGAASAPGGLPLPLPLPGLRQLPVIVPSDQAQIQEQLQRKHEQLQNLIARQQEELRRVKEQLLLARLGILQPLINVPNAYASVEEVQQQNPRMQYEGSQPRPPMQYPPPPPPPPPSNPDHQPPMP